MGIMEAIKSRHAVRSYEDRAITGEARYEMQELLTQLNRESGLNMQLVLNEPKAFSGFMAHYGKFSGVKNYIALIGTKGPGLDEDCGYYGEKAVLKAQQLGLNTCWVAMTYQKVPSALQIGPGEPSVSSSLWGMAQTRACPTRARARRRRPGTQRTCLAGSGAGWTRPCWPPRL